MTVEMLYLIFVRLGGWMALLALGSIQRCRAAGASSRSSSAEHPLRYGIENSTDRHGPTPDRRILHVKPDERS